MITSELEAFLVCPIAGEHLDVLCRVGLLHVGKSPPAILYQMGCPHCREHTWEDKQKVQLLAQPYSLVSPPCRKGQGY